MSLTRAERDGVKGVYLDSPFRPIFFPDTPEGKKALSAQIDFEIRLAISALCMFGALLVGIGVVVAFAFT